jgi:hypothetical protein
MSLDVIVIQSNTPLLQLLNQAIQPFVPKPVSNFSRSEEQLDDTLNLTVDRYQLVVESLH